MEAIHIVLVCCTPSVVHVTQLHLFTTKMARFLANIVSFTIKMDLYASNVIRGFAIVYFNKCFVLKVDQKIL